MISGKFWTGIGSRSCPWDLKADMQEIAMTLEIRGYTLRSGNAEGCDQNFASGVDSLAQIWLPWPSFNIEFQKQHPKHTYKVISENDIEAIESVNKFHPAPHLLSRGARAMHQRNFRQVKGGKLPNSEFVICWTPNGEEKGGTATAIKIAKSLDIPVYNLFDLTKQEILDKVLPQ